jgi:FtsZ-binding cell division protein ZapB
VGLFSKKQPKVSANEPFNPFIDNNAAGPIDVTPVSAENNANSKVADETANEVAPVTAEAVTPGSESVATAPAETAVAEAAPAEATTVETTPVEMTIPITEGSENSAAPDAPTQEEITETPVMEAPVPENAEVEMPVVETPTTEPSVVDSFIANNPAQPEAEESIISSIAMETPEVTEDSLVAAAESGSGDINSPTVEEAIMEEPSGETPLIPSDSVIEENTGTIGNAEGEIAETIVSGKRSKVPIILLVIATVVSVGLAGASVVLYMKWQDQQNLTLDKEQQINTLNQRLDDQDSVEADIQKLNSEITSLKEENKTLNSDKLKLEENNKTLTEENNKLKTQNEELQAKVNGGGTPSGQ